MRITRVKAKNLSSWEDLDFVIPKGVSQITGWNHDDGCGEGCGKSGILYILPWTIFGKIPKEAKVDEFVRDGSGSGWGQVYFDDDYSIKRSRKPNNLVLVDPDGKESKISQECCIKRFGRSFDIFCQTIYFPQNFNKRFITADEETKAKVFTEMQGLEIFDKASKLANLRMQEKSKDIELKRVKLQGESEKEKDTKKEIEWVEGQISGFSESMKEKIAEVSKKIKNLKSRLELVVDLGQVEEKIKDLKNSVAEKQKELKSAERLNMKSSELISENDRIKRELTSLKSRRSEIKLEVTSASPDKCNECQQSINFTEHEKWLNKKGVSLVDLKSRMKSLKLSISEVPGKVDTEELEESLDTLESDLDTVEEDKRLLVRNIDKNAILNSQISELKESKVSLKQEKPVHLMKKLDELTNKFSTTQVKYISLYSEVQQLQKEINYLDSLRKGFKKVKIYVFKSALQELSSTTNKYLRSLFNVSASIQFSSEESSRGNSKIKTSATINGKSRSLGLYSGGQMKRISQATELALNSIDNKRSSKPLGLRIFDEPLKDLSPQSKKKFMDLLATMSGDTILIEHDEVTKSFVENKFEISYKNGVSTKVG